MDIYASVLQLRDTVEPRSTVVLLGVVVMFVLFGGSTVYEKQSVEQNYHDALSS